MNQFIHGLTLFFSLFLEALPFLVLGIAVSSVLLAFGEGQLSARFPRHPLLGALVGSCLGMVIPVCQYGNVPVARRLIIGGVPLPGAIAFLVAAPTVNPVVLWLTATAFPLPQIVVWRVVFTLAMAIGIGSIFGTYSQQLEDYSKELPAILLSGTVKSPLPKPKRRISKLPQTRWLQFLDNFRQEFLYLGAVLLVGSAIAAVVQTFVPQENILALGRGNITNVLVFLLWGTILSIGSDAHWVSTFTTSYTDGALLAFLLMGAVIDLKSVCLLLSVFRWRAVLYLIILSALLTFGFSLSYDFYL